MDFSKVRVTNKLFIKDSSFKLPSDQTTTPMIMIGPGTGVAPFIAFMQEREMLRERNPDIKLADAYLFFGCRKSTSDFIYRDDIAKYKGDGTVNEVFIAFSRDNPNTKIYV